MVLKHQYQNSWFSPLVLLRSCSLPQKTETLSGELADAWQLFSVSERSCMSVNVMLSSSLVINTSLSWTHITAESRAGLCSVVSDPGVSLVPGFLFVFPNRCANIYSAKGWPTEFLFDTVHASLRCAEWLQRKTFPLEFLVLQLGQCQMDPADPQQKQKQPAFVDYCQSKPHKIRTWTKATLGKKGLVLYNRLIEGTWFMK